MCQVCRLPIEAQFSKDTGSEPALNFDPLCATCRLQGFRFDKARSVFRYEDALVRGIVICGLKVRLNAEVRGSRSAGGLVRGPACRKERGFNQAELLSKRGAKRLKLPH